MIAKTNNSKEEPERKNVFKNMLEQFKGVTKDSYEYLSIQNSRAENIKTLLKDLYGSSTKEDDINKNPEVLPELVLAGMDEEQIWQQIEIRNNCVWPRFVADTSHFLSLKERNFEINVKNDHQTNEQSNLDDDNVEDDDADEDYFEDSEDDDSGDGTEKIVPKRKRKKHGKSIVDDKFFKLREMEEFLNAEDEKEKLRNDRKKHSGEGEVDYFNEDLSDEDEENVNYKDFFDQDSEDDDAVQNPNKADDKAHRSGSEEDETAESENGMDKIDEDEEGSVKSEENVSNHDDDNTIVDPKSDGEMELDEEADSDISDTDQNSIKEKSSFEMRQERLKNRIEEYEEQALSEKPWQLKGEIIATGRPQNSLLEEVLEFDSTTRPAPIVTEETTLRLEDVIKQRIKNKAWDDVERKVKPIQTPQEFRKQLILDQEKSKESLAQIYEKEYQKELQKIDPNREENEEEPKEHKEIKELMKTLFNKLDALSNYHYTPKPAAPEPRIITNTPAIVMEEVAPVAVSDAKLLAPEEIKKHVKGDIIGKGERTKTDKNRERRKKKTRQRAIHKAKEERMLEKQKLGLKLSTKEEKSKALKTVMKNRNVQKANTSTEGTSLKSSKAFFTQLQDKISVKVGKEHKKPPSNSLSAKKLKL